MNPESDRAASEARVRALMPHLDSLVEGADTAARLVACGDAAIGPLREFLIHGHPRGVYEPRLWAVQALGGLGADDVLIEYLRQPIASSDAEVRFAEEVVRSGAARALTDSDAPDATAVLFDVARRERLPGALEAIAERLPERAVPLLVAALADDFARDAAASALRGLRAAASDALIEAALDRGARPLAARGRRLAALNILRDVPLSPGDWRRLEPLLDEDDDAEIVCAVSLLGAEVTADPPRMARRLLDVLPGIGWEWRQTLEDVVVTCMRRSGNGDVPPPGEADTPMAQEEAWRSWRRIRRRLGLS